jgi:hypothetical protein
MHGGEAMRHRLTMTDIPEPVLQLLDAAVAGRLLDDVDTMAGHLESAGWVRETYGGSVGAAHGTGVERAVPGPRSARVGLRQR